MTIVRIARLPLLLSALSVVLACGDCGLEPTDGGVDDGGADTGPGDAGKRDAGGDPRDAGDGDAGSDGGPGGLPSFTYATECDISDGPGTPGELGLVEAFPGLSFSQPLFMTPGPGTGRLYVIEQGGMVWSFDPDDAASTKAPFLDLTAIVNSGGERGLLGIAFHPSFTTNRAFFLSYTERRDNQLWSVIARYTAQDATTADPNSEERLLVEAQPYSNHNGGMISFGPDGYLYIGFGDGGGGGDPDENGQDLTTLLGKLLRIDVDREDAPRAYGIPADNPFADGAGGEPEIFAWGLRNPWRWSFDRRTGDLWLADVGQNQWEEVNVVPADTLSAGTGVNFGWDVFEGFACYEPPTGEADCSSVSGTHLPELVYSHSDGQSITGGYVYRGSAMPSQEGRYFYGDFVSRALWAYDPSSDEGHGASIFVVPGNGVPSFAEDEAGELYVLEYGGTIYRIVETAPGVPAPPPATLGATGCFTDLETLTPASGVLPYDVNMPLWSDGSEKQRWLVLPEGGRITFDEAGKWTFPTGTVLIKHFAMDTTRGDESTRVRLETRFIVVEPEGVRGFTYRWREDESDADLLTSNDSRSLTLLLEEGGEPINYSWSFPGPSQCLQCHTTASTGVLGVETAQLNREKGYGGAVVNQLEALTAWGLFHTAPSGDLGSLPRFPELEDESASVGERTRAWLHANCASCHLPGGPTGRLIDLRYTTPLDEMHACDVPPEGSNYGIEGARLIKPGDPDLSLLYYRDMNANARMPPLGTSLIPDEAGAVQRAWIEGLTGCTE